MEINCTRTMLYLLSIICILLICSGVFFMSSLLFGKDINNTVLGRSVVGNVYETVVPVAFSYINYEFNNNYNIAKWNSERTRVINPPRGSYNIKLPPGIRFRVENVTEARGFLNIKIKLLNNVPTTSIQDYVEADDVEIPGFRSWVQRDIFYSKNPFLPEIFDKNVGLKIKGLNINLYDLHSFEFFYYENGNPNKDEPLIMRENMIKLVMLG